MGPLGTLHLAGKMSFFQQDSTGHFWKNNNNNNQNKQKTKNKNIPLPTKTEVKMYILSNTVSEIRYSRPRQNRSFEILKVTCQMIYIYFYFGYFRVTDLLKIWPTHLSY